MNNETQKHIAFFRELAADNLRQYRRSKRMFGELDCTTSWFRARYGAWKAASDYLSKVSSYRVG